MSQKKLKEEREKRVIGGFNALLEEAEELEARLAVEKDMGEGGWGSWDGLGGWWGGGEAGGSAGGREGYG